MTALEAAALAANAAVIVGAAGIALLLTSLPWIVQAWAGQDHTCPARTAVAEQVISTGDITRDLMRLAHTVGVVPE